MATDEVPFILLFGVFPPYQVRARWKWTFRCREAATFGGDSWGALEDQRSPLGATRHFVFGHFWSLTRLATYLQLRALNRWSFDAWP